MRQSKNKLDTQSQLEPRILLAASSNDQQRLQQAKEATQARDATEAQNRKMRAEQAASKQRQESKNRAKIEAAGSTTSTAIPSSPTKNPSTKPSAGTNTAITSQPSKEDTTQDTTDKTLVPTKMQEVTTGPLSTATEAAKPTTASSVTETDSQPSKAVKNFGNGFAIDGKKVTKDGQPFVAKSVAYSSENQGFELVAGGYQNPDSTYETVNSDFQTIAKTGANSVRIYDPQLTVPGAFDVNSRAAENNGLGMYVTFPTNDPQAVEQFVTANRENKNIYGYVVGNEVNGNNFYGTGTDPVQTSIDLSKTIRKADQNNHPIYSSWGDIPDQSTVRKLDSEGEFDGHMTNYYRDPSSDKTYSQPLRQFASSTDKPVIIGEYGYDSYDHTRGEENRESQAVAHRLANDKLADLVDSGHIQGSTVFGFKDQIHRSDASNAISAKLNGTGKYDAEPAYPLGYEPSPDVPANDGVQNDEYLGILDADGNPKPVFNETTRFFTNS